MDQLLESTEDGNSVYTLVEFSLKQQVFISVRAVEESLAFSLRLPYFFANITAGLLGMVNSYFAVTWNFQMFYFLSIIILTVIVW